MNRVLQHILDAVTDGAADYSYPDQDNRMEAQVIPQARRDEERRLWESMLPARIAGVALDAGCGRGAFTGLLADRADAVLAVDADQTRVAVARAQHQDRAAFRVRSLMDPVFSSEKLRGAFACVSCIQVLGHVPLNGAAIILSAFHHLLQPDGLLILAVPFVNHFSEEHRLVRTSEAQPFGHPITPQRYDALALTPEAGVLPVRHFTAASLTALVEKAGFSAERMEPCNWYSERRADMMVQAHRRPT